MKIVVDLDNTLTLHNSHKDYSKKSPNKPLIEALRRYKEKGFSIIINTSRNMRTFDGSIGKINVHTLPDIITWLDRHHVPYDEVYVGKPWCGTKGFYIDDRAIRPSEFVKYTYDELLEILSQEK